MGLASTKEPLHLLNASDKTAVRVKGRTSVRNGIIMRNVKYGKWRKEIN